MKESIKKSKLTQSGNPVNEKIHKLFAIEKLKSGTEVLINGVIYLVTDMRQESSLIGKQRICVKITSGVANGIPYKTMVFKA